jgi:hypothetical protein
LPDQSHRREFVNAAVFTLAIFVVLWLRRPDSLLNAQFWAEDGGVFFREQVLLGFGKALVRPYSGYLHAIPRIIAAAICMLPVRWVPLGFNLCTLSLEAISCSAFFWPCYRKVIASDLLRATCCLVATASIVAGSELIATLSNVQWYLCILSLLLILVTTRRLEIGLTILQVCIAFTAPLTLLYVPFLLWQTKKNSAALKLRPIFHLLALFAQAWIMRQDVSSGPRRIFQFNSLFLATIGGGLSRCLLSPLIGSSFLRNDRDVALFATLAIGLIMGTALAALLTVRLVRSPQIKWLFGAVYIGVGSLLAVMYGRGVAKPFVTLDGLRNYTAERYFFIGACMFIFCCALALETFIQSKNRIIPPVILAFAFAWGTAQNFSANTFQDMHWPENAAKIEKWKAARREHESSQTLSVPINPNLQLVLD